MSRKSHLMTTGLLCLVSAAIVASVVAFALHRPIPESLAVASPPSETVLIAEEMTDERLVELTVRLGEASALMSPATGTVTSSSCEPGGTLNSGSRTFVINETPLVNLHTTTPLWRDLSLGMTGTDVTALQEELIRLGYDVAATDVFDEQTWSAWNRLFEKQGGTARHGILARNQVMWLPQDQTRVAACSVHLGRAAVRGAPLLGLPALLLSAGVKSLPTDLVPGDRQIVVDGTVIPTDQAGQLAADGLDALASTAWLTRLLMKPDSESQGGFVEFALAEPITIYPLPPSAIAMMDSGEGCVASLDGDAYRVDVVSSRMGRSYVSFPEGLPAVMTVEVQVDRRLTCS